MTDHKERPLPASTLGALVAMLDVVVLERFEGGAFRQVGDAPTPEWFTEALRDAAAGAPVTLLEAFPLLDGFLSEADTFWRQMAHGRLEGEAFVVAGPGGRNLPLATTAVAMDGRHFLIIQRVSGFDDRQQILQRAREQALSHEQVVKRIDGLRPPFGRLARLVSELGAAGGLTDAHRVLLDAAEAELGTLGQVLDDLPKPPPGRHARRR
jgi:hypothetical protein